MTYYEPFNYEVGQEVEFTEDFIEEMEDPNYRAIIADYLVEFYDKNKNKKMTLIRVDDKEGDGLYTDADPNLELSSYEIQTIDDPHEKSADPLQGFTIIYKDDTDIGTLQ